MGAHAVRAGGVDRWVDNFFSGITLVAKLTALASRVVRIAARRAHRLNKKSALVNAGFFIARTPLLPFDALNAWSRELRSSRTDACAPIAELEAALTEDLSVQRARIGEWLADPMVQESLYLASPGFVDSLAIWKQQPDSERGQKVEGALVRYLQRMMTRSTPFGLMAGISVGTFGPSSRFEVPSRESLRRHSRLDMDYLQGMLGALSQDPGLHSQLRYFPNSSLFRVSDRLRYIERKIEGGDRRDVVISCEASELLVALLERARVGASPPELTEWIVTTDTEIDSSDASGFVEELIATQLLVSELEPAVTGEDPLASALATLKSRAPSHRSIAVLEEVNRGLSVLDETVQGVDAEQYRALVAKLEQLGHPVEAARTFQVEMVKPGTGFVLGAKVFSELAAAAKLLHRLTGANGVFPEAMKQFTASFQLRYEDAEVPLALALDEEAGIGFDRFRSQVEPALIQGLHVQHQAGSKVGTPAPLRLTDLLGRAQRAGSQEIELSAEDLAEIEHPHEIGAGQSLSITAVLVGRSTEAVNQGQFELVVSRGSPGAPAARSMGRFCATDPELQRRVIELCSQEAKLRPGTVLAEVAYLPLARNGNVMHRPVLREYEIPFMARSGAPIERQLSIDDLRLSIREGRLFLRSASLNQEVIPFSTTSYNYINFGHALARFLWYLSNQQASNGQWSWYSLEAPFFPRVRVGRVILSLATWHLSSEQTVALCAPTRSGRWRAAQALRMAEKMPRFVQLPSGDQDQVVDFDSPLSVEAFCQSLTSGTRTVVTELYPGPDQLVFEGPGGRYTHELQVPLLVDTPLPAMPPVVPAPEQRYLPGSDHLSVKLYTGYAGADRLLIELVAPLFEKWRATGQVSHAYFVRFGDPDWHLRVRMLGAPAVLLHQVYPELLAEVAARAEVRQLWRAEQDTFTPERQRYGGTEGFACAEKLFGFDAQAVCATLASVPGEAGLDSRWRLALVSADRIFEDLGLSQHERIEIAGSWRRGLEREFTFDKDALSRTCRQERAAVELLLRERIAEEPGLQQGLIALERRSVLQQPVCAQLRAAAAAGRLTLSLPELASSLVHLSANRWLRSGHRQQELVLYTLLERYYLSSQARSKTVS